MKHWTIGRKLFTGFAGLLLLLAILAASSLRTISSLSTQSKRTTSVTARTLETSGQIQRGVFELRAASRLIIIAAARQQGDIVKSEIAENEKRFAALKTAVGVVDKLSDDPAVDQRCKGINEAIAGWQGGLGKMNTAASNFSAIEAMDADDAVAPNADKTTKLAREIGDIASKQLAADEAAAASSTTAAWTILSIIVAFTLVVAVGVAWAVWSVNNSIKGIVVQIREGAEQVAAASSEVSGSAQSLSQGSSEQAASLEETSASMEEMSSMTRRNAENTEEVSRLMANAEVMIGDSNKSLAEMVKSMTSIRESSSKVSKIIKTIDEIAFQTNLLALNAAVEAARAGEAGMGFAVVADEVRSLAQRSAQAARDTSALIEDSMARSEEGGTRVTQVESSIVAVTENFTQIKRLVDEVSQASRQQAQGFDQVSQAIAQMEKVTQTTAATAEESAAASAQLTGQAEQSMIVVKNLEALVGAQGGAAAPVAAATTKRNPVKAAVRAAKAPAAARPRTAERALTPEEQIPLEGGDEHYVSF